MTAIAITTDITGTADPAAQYASPEVRQLREDLALALRAAAQLPDRVVAVASFHGGNLAPDDATGPQQRQQQRVADLRPGDQGGGDPQHGTSHSGGPC